MELHVSGSRCPYLWCLRVYWTPATNSKPQTKLHHPNDYHWTVLMPIQRGIPIAMFDNQRVQCLPGKASRCQGRFQWPAYTFTSPVRTPVWTHCLGKTMEKPTIRLLPQVWASCKNQTSCWCLGSGFRQCPEEKAAQPKCFVCGISNCSWSQEAWVFSVSQKWDMDFHGDSVSESWSYVAACIFKLS